MSETPPRLTSQSLAEVVLDSGRLVDGRVFLPRFSKLAARFAEAMGLRSRLMRSVEAAQEASDNLKSKGFDPKAIDRVMWLVNEPFPMCLLPAAERLFREPPVGVISREGRPERAYGTGKLQGLRLWRLSLSEGAAQMGRWPEEEGPPREGLGGKRLVALVALGSGSAQRSLAREGLSAHESKRFVAGHELGHVVFKAAAHEELFSKILDGLGMEEADEKGRLLVRKSAEELFADALGALAADPASPERAMAAVQAMRAQRSLSTMPAPIYMEASPLRSRVWERLSGGGWSGQDGGLDLAVECLAMAVAHWASLPVQEARAKVAELFEAQAGRPWAGPEALGLNEGQPAPQRPGVLPRSASAPAH